jgi:hypothetical protein
MQQKLEERKYLNEQIMNHQRLLVQIFTFSIIAGVAILGWGLQSFPASGEDTSSTSLFLLLAPIGIVIPCAYMIKGIREEIFRWGAYIILFHEREGTLAYENLLDKLRDILRDKRHKFRESYSAIWVAYVVLCLICAILFVVGIWRSGTIHYGWSAVALVPLGFLIHWCKGFRNIPSESSRKQYKDDWRKAEKGIQEQ